MVRQSPTLKKSDDQYAGLLTTAQAAAFLGYKPRMLEGRRARGDGPNYIRLSARAVRYRVADLDAWVESKIKSSAVDQ